MVNSWYVTVVPVMVGGCVAVGAGIAVGWNSPGMARVMAMKTSGVGVAGSIVATVVARANASVDWPVGASPVMLMQETQVMATKMNRVKSKARFFMVGSLSGSP